MSYLLLALVVIVLLGGLSLSYLSHKGHAAGVVDGKLTPCPETPNCVCSEVSGKGSSIEAFTMKGDVTKAWENVSLAVEDSGGEIVQHSDNYLAAIYTSRFFHFVDDLELRLDAVTRRIQVRSASRVGHSDFGVNRRRIERLRKAYLVRMGNE